MPIPYPTPIYRLLHVDNLHICLEHRGLHAPNFTPNDGLVYRTIHNVQVQQDRHVTTVPCGPCDTVHDYVPFYFGPLSPMMLNLKTGRVVGYNEGQEPLIYLVSTCQAVQDSGARFVFSDGHGLAFFTEWFDDLAKLDKVDWTLVHERYWRDTIRDGDRQRRKQAEFLVHQSCSWSLIGRVAVIDTTVKARVEAILASYPAELNRPVIVRPNWYYH